MRWNTAVSEYRLTEQVAHPSPNVLIRHKAYFQDFQPASLLVQSFEGLSGGHVGFKDPWYLHSNGTQPDSFFTYTSPFSPTGAWNQSTGGVFLNQDPQSGSPVYYSARAPDTVTVNGTLWGFINWSSTNVDVVTPTSQSGGFWTTPVVFRSGASRSVTANYKGHRLSSNLSATGPQGQRKIGQASNGHYYMVYESGGRIWFSRSSDGAAWSREKEVGTYDPAQPESMPSLTVVGTRANIVWQRTYWLPPFHEEAKLMLRSYDGSGDTWGSIQTLVTEQVGSSAHQLHPVIDAVNLSPGGTSDAKAVAWKASSALKVNVCVDGSWGTAATVTGTSGSAVDPSIAAYSSTIYFLAWRDTNTDQVKFIEATHSGTFQNGFTVSSNWTGNASPSIAVSDGNKAVVAWASYDGVSEGHAAMVRRRSPSGSWGSITSFSMNNYGLLRPSIGTQSVTAGMTLVWSFEGSIYAATYDGVWSGASLLAAADSGGSYPSINAQSPSAFRAMWRRPSGSIHITGSGLNQGGVASGLTDIAASAAGQSPVGDGLRGTPLPYRLNRHLVSTRADGSFIAFEIAGIRKTGTSGSSVVPLAPLSLEGDLPERALRSEPNVPEATARRLSFSGAVYGRGLSDLKKELTATRPLRFDVRLKTGDGRSRSVWTFDAGGLISGDNGSFGEFRSIEADLSDLTGVPVEVEVVPLGLDDSWETHIVDDHLLLPAPATQLAETGAPAEPLPQIPSAYALHQNYPNPFNPSTSIAFDLPRTDHVRLELFDVLGKPLRMILDGQRGAGRHVVNVMLSELPSGVYFYRLTAGSFVASRQLSLIK